MCALTRKVTIEAIGNGVYFTASERGAGGSRRCQRAAEFEGLVRLSRRRCYILRRRRSRLDARVAQTQQPAVGRAVGFAGLPAGKRALSEMALSSARA